MISDLIDFLDEPWALFYQHDGFSSLRSGLLSRGLPHFDPKGDNDTIKAMTLEAVMNFVRSHLAELPGLTLPEEMSGGSPSAAPGAELLPLLVQ